jgi:tetratricopeptide (TPR) repeat protein
MLLQPTRLLLAVSIAGLLWVGPMRMHGQASPGPEKKYKDDAEFPLYDSILKDTNPKTKLDKLQEWERKYPSTDFIKERRQLFFATYLAAQMPKETMAAAQQVLADDPKDFNALYYTMFLLNVVYQGNQPALLDQAEKACNALLASIDTAPPGVDADKWAKLRPDIERMSHATLGFIGVQRQNWDSAEGELKKVLQLDPNGTNCQPPMPTWACCGNIDYLMYYTLAKKKNYSPAFFYYARAAAYDGTGASLAAQRQGYMSDVQKLYTTYHGSTEGFSDLLAMAKTTPNPPDGFHIKSKGEIAKESYEKESANAEKFAKDHPDWALWKSIKETLTSATGADYFNSNMKDAKVPTLKGRVVKLEPAIKPKAILLAMEDGTSTEATTADATLKFDAALAGKVEPGTELSFEGVGVSYTANPLMVVFNIAEKGDLHGWTGKNAPAAPVRHRPAAKK